jgi:hypothetical protein
MEWLRPRLIEGDVLDRFLDCADRVFGIHDKWPEQGGCDYCDP